MEEIFGLFRIIVIFIIASTFLTNFKRVRFNALPKVKSKPSVYKPVKMDFVKSYSSKNKECYEHEVKSSAVEDQPKRRKGLWNEPSWDDELYEKK